MFSDIFKDINLVGFFLWPETCAKDTTIFFTEFDYTAQSYQMDDKTRAVANPRLKARTAPFLQQDTTLQ